MDFLVGAGKADITPNIGSPTRRWHYGDERARIREIRWPMFARTVALSDGERFVTITSIEVAAWYKCHHDAVRALVRERIDRPIDAVILHNTHQHSDSFIEYEPGYDQFGINDAAFDMAYIERLPGAVVESIRAAIESLRPATMGHAAGAIPTGLASCRRIVTEQGVVNRGSRPPVEKRRLPQGHIDPEVGVVAFVEPDGRPIASLYNYACHPASAGGDSPNVCTADFPGFASDIVERVWGGVSVFLSGCGGDINVAHFVRGESFDNECRVADARRFGQILAGETLKVLGLIEAAPVERLAAATKECALPVQDRFGEVEQCLAEAKRAVEEWKRHGGDPRKELRKYITSLKLVDGRCPVAMGAVAVDDVAMAFIPGEPFTAYGEAIKRDSSAARTLVAATCGEEPFYIPTAEALDQGGYETTYVASRETGEALLREIGALMGEVVGTVG